MSICEINLIPIVDINLLSSVDITNTFIFDLWLMVSLVELLTSTFCTYWGHKWKNGALCPVLIIYFCLSNRALVEVKHAIRI